MKVGDLVRVIPAVCLTYGRTPEDIGLILSFTQKSGSPIILWSGKTTLFGRPDFLEVIDKN